MNTSDWIRVADLLPEREIVVDTKIKDLHGERNHQQLKRGSGRLWFFPDGSMYVYYEPTHWRPVSQAEAEARGDGEVMDAEQVIRCLSSTTGLPTYGKQNKQARRSIYEAGKGPKLDPSGHFYITYASFPGGSGDEVPRSVIDELESLGAITREYPGTKCNSWVLADRRATLPDREEK